MSASLFDVVNSASLFDVVIAGLLLGIVFWCLLVGYDLFKWFSSPTTTTTATSEDATSIIATTTSTPKDVTLSTPSSTPSAPSPTFPELLQDLTKNRTFENALFHAIRRKIGSINGESYPTSGCIGADLSDTPPANNVSIKRVAVKVVTTCDSSDFERKIRKLASDCNDTIALYERTSHERQRDNYMNIQWPSMIHHLALMCLHSIWPYNTNQLVAINLYRVDVDTINHHLVATIESDRIGR